MKLRGLVKIFADEGHDEPDIIPGYEPTTVGCRTLLLGIVLFWVAVIGGIVWLNN